jgi:hypothetical protein
MPFDTDPRVAALATTQDGLVTASQAIQLGYSRARIANLLRAQRWRSLAPGVYLVDAYLFGDPLPPRTWWRAALLFNGPQSCLVASTVMRLYGVHGLPLAEPRVEVGVVGGPSRHGRCASELDKRGRDESAPTFVVRQFDIAAEELEVHADLRVRRFARSLVDTALESDRATALALLDSALHQQLVSRDELWREVMLATGRRGVVALRQMFRLADARAESQVESRVRLACADGKVPPDELQFPVRDEFGNLLAVGDMAWLKGRRRPLIAEADGESVHSLPAAVYRDRRRGNSLVAQACDTVRFTFADSLRPAYIVSAVRAALAA